MISDAVLDHDQADVIYAPFTEEQIRNLNNFQRYGLMHPFTCGNSHSGDGALIADLNGWHCPNCDYVQNWAYAGMARDHLTYMRCLFEKMFPDLAAQCTSIDFSFDHIVLHFSKSPDHYIPTRWFYAKIDVSINGQILNQQEDPSDIEHSNINE